MGRYKISKKTGNIEPILAKNILDFNVEIPLA